MNLRRSLSRIAWALTLVAVTAPSLSSPFPVPGPGRSAYGAGGGDFFVALAESTDWGPGGSVMDLTDAIPQFRALSEQLAPNSPALPLDTTGWNTIVVNGSPYACTGAGVQAAISSVGASCNNVIDVSACTSGVDVTVADEGGEAGHVRLVNNNAGDCKHGLVLRGDPVSRTVLNLTRSYDIEAAHGADSGLRERFLMLGVGSSTFTPIATWTWLVGPDMALNSTTIISSSAITGVYPGDIVEMRADTLPDPWLNEGANRPRAVRRVVCARWGGVAYGTGCSATDNSIIIDAPLTMDYRPAASGGPYVMSSVLTGHEIRHLERMSTNGGDARTNGNYVYVGVENIELSQDIPHLVSGGRGALHVGGVLYGWAKNVKVGEWGGTPIQIGWVFPNHYVSNFLITGSEWNGSNWGSWGAPRVSTLSLAPVTNNVRLTLNLLSSGAGQSNADRWSGLSGNLEVAVYIPPTCVADGGGGSVAGLHGIRAFERVGSWVSGSVTIELLGVNGTGMDTTPNCWVKQLRAFDTASIRPDNAVTGLQIENNNFINTRPFMLLQGAHETVFAYNEMHVNSGWQGVRFLNHEGPGSLLFEGNATKHHFLALEDNGQANGPGQGPHTVFYRNEFLREVLPAAWGGVTNTVAGHIGSQAHASREGSTDEYRVLFGNLFSGQIAGGRVVDDDLVASGVPHVRNMRSTGNLWQGFNGDALFDTTPNATTLRDSTEADEGSELSASDRARAYPRSLYRTTVPSWWCTQSGVFPNIGAPSYTAATPSNLPAKIRRLGTTCTAP